MDRRSVRTPNFYSNSKCFRAHDGSAVIRPRPSFVYTGKKNIRIYVREQYPVRVELLGFTTSYRLTDVTVHKPIDGKSDANSKCFVPKS